MNFKLLGAFLCLGLATNLAMSAPSVCAGKPEKRDESGKILNQVTCYIAKGKPNTAHPILASTFFLFSNDQQLIHTSFSGVDNGNSVFGLLRRDQPGLPFEIEISVDSDNKKCHGVSYVDIRDPADDEPFDFPSMRTDAYCGKQTDQPYYINCNQSGC